MTTTPIRCEVQALTFRVAARYAFVDAVIYDRDVSSPELRAFLEESTERILDGDSHYIAELLLPSSMIDMFLLAVTNPSREPSYAEITVQLEEQTVETEKWLQLRVETIESFKIGAVDFEGWDDFPPGCPTTKG